MDAGIIANFKSHYRHLYTLDVLCPALEAGEPPSYELYDAAVEVMIQAWDLVTPRTIARCFRHAGFKHPGVTENTPEEDLPLVQLAARLQAAGMPCSIEDANRILTEDEGLQTHGLMSDQDIIDEVLGTNTEEDGITSSQEMIEIPEVVQAKPTYSQYMAAVDTIRLYCIYSDGPDWETAHRLSLQLKTIGQQNGPIRTQTNMSQYFNKNKMLTLCFIYKLSFIF